MDIPLNEGILLVDKPIGKTSFWLVAVLRKRLGIKKIGHAGTLDPFASGVMVMLIGKNYTRLSDKLLHQDKEYRARIKLGAATDSHDLDGEIGQTSDKVPTPEEVEKELSFFQGEVEQVPPMFSAKKIGGKKLCDLARKGIVVERAPVLVTLESTLLHYEYPYIDLKIKCSKGTYIRSIAHDLGIRLGCFGHLVELQRTRSGLYPISACISSSQLLDDSFSLTPHLIRTL